MRQFAVILPTYNEMNTDFIQKSVPLLTSFPHLHVIAVDKGSQDGTLEWLKQFKVQILHSDAQMRAQRLNQGILASTSEWILLHHPRSIIDKNGLEYLGSAHLPLWGAFTHKFDLEHPLLNFTSWYSNHVRGDGQGIYYLDHCLFFNKYLLADNDKQPVPEVAIFEDTEFCKKLLKKSQPQRINFLATTSSVRFQKNGMFYQSMLNQMLKVGYQLKMSDDFMNRLYEKGLSLNSKY